MKKLLIAAFVVTIGFFCVFKEAYTAPNGVNIGAVPKATAILAANLVLKSKCVPQNCILASFEVSADTTLSGAAWWILIYDAATAPGDGTVTPLKCYAQASGTTSVSAAFTTPPLFVNGVVIAVSTTGCFTQTSSTHAFIAGDVQ